jgi:hypothetical protein
LCVKDRWWVLLTRARKSFLSSKGVYRFSMVCISRLRSRMLREDVVTEERRSVQVEDVNRKAGTGVNRLEKVKG